MPTARPRRSYPANVMACYDAGWRAYTVCGILLSLMIVTVIAADAVHAGRSPADIAVGATLFVFASVFYVRGFRRMRDFQRLAREYRATHPN